MTTTRNKMNSSGEITHKAYQISSLKVFVPIMLIFVSALITIPSYAQNAVNTTDGRFHDDLLDHLVGKWDVSSTAHGKSFTGDFEAEWIMNHQHLHIHLKSHEIIPWWKVQMEFEQFIGYNYKNSRYVVHGMSIEGYDYDPSEGFCYGYRTDNEFKTVAKFGSDSLIVQRFTWSPTSRSWTIKSTWEIGGKEGDVFLELNLVAAKPSSKWMKTINK